MSSLTIEEVCEEKISPESGVDSCGSSITSNKSITSTSSKNPFFANIPSLSQNNSFDIDDLPDEKVKRADSPATIQKNLCLNATSMHDPHPSSDEDDDTTGDKNTKKSTLSTNVGRADSPATIQKNLCLNATSMHDPHPSSDEDDDTTGDKNTKKSTLSTNVGCPCSSTPDNGIWIKGNNQNFNLNFPYHTHNILDDYKISDEIIGIGESGKVMACYRKSDDKKFALKVLRDSPKARREVGIHYLTHQHENIVTIIDIYENTFHDVKCLLLVVEFMEGGDLLTKFENQASVPYTEKQVGEIAYQIGKAVKYLHSLSIAHRDLKLENILCSSTTNDCTYKLADFGFAKLQEKNKMLDSPCCTFYYAPPEILGREQYNFMCDMWSIGVALYILLCGYPPFYSMKGLPISPGMKSRIAAGCYAFPAAEWDVVSESTKNVIRNLLKTDPALRTTIDNFMKTPLVTGAISPLIEEPNVKEPKKVIQASSIPPKHQSKDSYESSFKKFDQITASKGYGGSKLHSIQEEVGRALSSMRLGNDSCYIKTLKTSQNGLLSRRQQSMMVEGSGLNIR
uniref:non-specific serine/threonine protein kinase n=1 Tax=Parastrongyloides trichosuri TaxID=131310 RepID=A0A0N5A1B9_PARTI